MNPLDVGVPEQHIDQPVKGKSAERVGPTRAAPAQSGRNEVGGRIDQLELAAREILVARADMLIRIQDSARIQAANHAVQDPFQLRQVMERPVRYDHVILRPRPVAFVEVRDFVLDDLAQAQGVGATRSLGDRALGDVDGETVLDRPQALHQALLDGTEAAADT